MSDYQNDGPWKWHIEETFKGLITLSIEALKALLLINGGAAVAILAYLSTLASHPPVAHLPNMKNALLCFASGVLVAAVTFWVAYFTQLRLYDEERARHEGDPFKTRHTIGIWIAAVLVVVSAGAFVAGCCIAASAFR